MNKVYKTIRYNYYRVLRLLEFFKKEGLIKSISRIVNFIIRLIYIKNEGYLLEKVNLEVNHKTKQSSKYEVKEIQEAYDLSHLFSDLTYNEVDFRLRDGQICFVAFFKKKPIGALWLTTKDTYFPGFEYRIAARSKWLKLGNNSGFIFRGAVDINHRGKNIMGVLQDSVAMKCKELGVDRVLGSIGKNNIAIRKNSIKANYRVKELVVCRRILGVLFRKVKLDENCN